MHRTLQRDRRHELALFDKENRRSLCALLPDAMVRQLDNLWASNDAYLLKVGDWELIKEAKRRGKEIGPLDHRLRAQFWFEYDAVQTDSGDSVPTMNMPRVIGRAIPKEVFYRYITEPVKLAWLLTPPADYTLMLEFAITHALMRMVEILQTPIVYSDGSPDLGAVEKMIRIYDKLEKRFQHMKNGTVLTGHGDGRIPGRVMSDKRIENAVPEETLEQKAERLMKENENLKLDLNKQAGVGQAEQND